VDTWTVEALLLSGNFRLAVLGDPVEHSLSPQMQNAALAARGLPYRYERLHVSPARLEEAFFRLRELGFIGWNLTLPHKIAGLSLVDRLDPEAVDLGAINTVLNRGGELIGFNTDGRGLQAALTEAFEIELTKARIAVLGAGGGAGQASARFLARLRPERLLLVNRTLAKMESLRAQLAGDPRVSFWDFNQLEQVFREADLIVNATSAGLAGGILDWNPGWLRADHRVFDMVYGRKAETPIVAWAKRNGIIAVDGRLMLLHQGAFAFEHWFGQPVPVQAMRDALACARCAHDK
jgi:shikimate dehydrogenase